MFHHTLTLSLPEATIVDHIPWLPLAPIGAVFTQYMWAGLSFSWHWQPEILPPTGQGMWSTIVASGNERVKHVATIPRETNFSLGSVSTHLRCDVQLLASNS